MERRELKGQLRLEWERAPLRALLLLAWPIVVSLLSYATMTLMDTVFVSRLGASALSGVGLGGMVSWVLIGFSIGLLRAVKILVSQSAGARQRQAVDAYRCAGLVLALALGLLTTAAGLVVAQVLPYITATESAGLFAKKYLFIRILGSVPVLLYVALREARYGLGDSKLPMRAALIGNFLNMVLDYLWIVVAGFGVAGAAWATVIGHTVEAAILLGAQTRQGLHWRSLGPNHIRVTWRLGVPTGLQFVLEFGAFSMLTAMLAALSDVDMAAHQIAIQVIHFSFLPAFALGEACSVLVGQAVGARRNALVRVIAHKGLAAAALYTGLGTLVLLIGARPITSAFTTDAALSLVTVQLLYVAAAFQVFDGANVIARGTLRGAGDVGYSATVCVATAWALTPPFGWLLAYKLQLGAFGGWLALCAEIMVGAAILWWRVERGGWLSAAQRRLRELPVPP
mgnify:CR=1 FL=1